MIILIFRIKKKIDLHFKKVINAYRIFEIKTLYPERFFYQKKLNFGNFFAVHFDQSKSIVNIGNQVEFRDHCQIRCGNNGKVTLGAHIFFNNHCSINCLSSIDIGNDCQFGEGVKFYDHNHQFSNLSLKINEQGYSFGSIHIGSNCWVGSNVIILKNVTIGDNVVIGAGCIIHKSVPSNTIIFNKQQLEQRVIEI